ncbi:hydrolase [Desulfosarcina alkanivorans]|uniref:Hydrolase n=1 Tax=Desulfosarcina alkanivorans TaxID=571177 RepID=A0A5K7YDD1_9BACT|nr:HAD family hydrolase [Desulfosarcina alkanivorans]BBO66976.1 hydrolase [Desulfosarcina alkanivorans]
MSIEPGRLNAHIRPLAPIPTGVAPDLSGMQPFSAVLFDVYGTLIISGAGEPGGHRKATDGVGDLRPLLKRHGIDQSPEQLVGALYRTIHRDHDNSRRKGMAFPEVDIVQVWRRVLGSNDLPRLKDFALEYELIVNPVYPMPGLRDLLDACQTGKVPMGLISNAQFYTVLLLRHILGGPLEKRGFDPRLLFFSWQEGHAKPSAVMFMRARKTLSDMGIAPSSVLYVGNDMQKDIIPAGNVGFKTGLFAGDRRSWRPMETADAGRGRQPDLVVTDLRQLVPGAANP